ncbi:RAD55 family ATPase [Archaeoglobus profundus]|uniref:Uncharacterized protein n=1 Tax=Archaeoglobus profundus (strain DSM 5631 / JCM 9629 / NBRC 100127 / Av18) TaxID=572546 RepID=D2RH20_ARCPA|nr:ATPase domain-containing protein [Archaeoglobus profundus]ADB57595.1 hypothetical protein Arcpr_0529 [Archaeoglobus profundus DSM 5631]
MGEVLISGVPGAGKTMLLMKIIKEFDNVIWVTTTRSAKTLRSILKSDDVWIIDTHTWAHVKFHPRDIVISNPLNLNEVNLGISRILDSINGKCLVVLDSLSGLLLYHNLQRVAHFLRSALVKMEEKNASGLFTLVKNAHDIHTETSMYALFPVVIELLREDNEETKRFIRVIKATKYIEPSFGEVKIVKDDIIVPEHIMEYILKVLKS